MMKKLLNKMRNHKGFTLLENILSMVIISIGLMGTMIVMQNAALNTVQGDMNTIATQYANEKVEEILADDTFQGYDYLQDGNYESEVIDGYDMNRSVQIVEVNSDDLTTVEEGSGLKKVTVTVYWDDGEADEQVIVSTLISDYE